MKSLFFIMLFGFLLAVRGDYEGAVQKRAWPEEKFFWKRFAEIVLGVTAGVFFQKAVASFVTLGFYDLLPLAVPALLAAVLLNRSAVFCWMIYIFAVFFSDDAGSLPGFFSKLSLAAGAVLVLERLFLALQLRLKLSPPLQSLRGLPAVFLAAFILTVFLGGAVRAFAYIF